MEELNWLNAINTKLQDSTHPESKSLGISVWNASTMSTDEKFAMQWRAKFT